MNIIEQDISSSYVPIGSILQIESKEGSVEKFIEKCKVIDRKLTKIKEVIKVENAIFKNDLSRVKQSLIQAQKEHSWLTELNYENVYEVIEENTYSSGMIWVLEQKENYYYINWYRES
jgi:hypothetical protein